MKEENSKEIENQTSKDYCDVSKSQICGDTSFMIENKEIKAKPKITKFMGYLFGFNKSINTFTQISAQKIIDSIEIEECVFSQNELSTIQIPLVKDFGFRQVEEHELDK